jgi:hypothetical protein
VKAGKLYRKKQGIQKRRGLCLQFAVVFQLTRALTNLDLTRLTGGDFRPVAIPREPLNLTAEPQ